MRLKIKDIKIKYKLRGYGASPSKMLAVHASLSDKDRDLAKFRKAVIQRIDKGRIIGWTMMVGAFPEKGIRAAENLGAHMRMIIGYNKKTDEVIYSDSWGRGHEVKRWTFKQAYVVTNQIYEISPR